MAWNPFRRAAETVGRALGNIQRAFEFRPSYLSQSPQSGVHYEVKEGRVLPRWAAGSPDGLNPPNANDLNQLLRNAPSQRGYAITITGILDGEYPGKEGVVVVTLSFRINRAVFRQALDNPHNRTAVDVANAVSEHGLKGNHWISIEQVTIIDKE